jgi:hypothetical protein
MTTQEPKDESALVKWEPQTIAVLEDYPEAQFNLLVPTQTIRQVNPYLVPDIETVKLSMIEADGEIYHDSQMKDGHYAPTAKGLSRIRQVAGIDELSSQRTDDRSDPDVIEWTVAIEMALPSGQRIRAHGSKAIDLHQLSQQKDRNGKPWSEARLSKAREHLLANAQTKALNRAIRSLLSLHGSMPKERFARPFAILRWVPNMSDPDVRRRMLDNLLPASVAAYGPEPQRIDAGAIEAPEAPDDEAEAEYVQVQTNGHATVDSATGEIVAEQPTSDEPDWFGEGPLGGLADRLRAVAEANAAATQPATKEQRSQLQEALRGISAGEVGTVLDALFDLGQLAAIERRHAQAILEVGTAIGHDQLRAEWRQLAADLEAAENAA